MLNRRRLIVGAALTACLPGCAPLDPVPTSDRARILIDAVREQMREFVFYDGGYAQLAYPDGDIPSGRGACTDVLIRAYRVLGLDLQQLVHEDMLAHFDAYPKTWGLKAPDSNIDHRRVPNLACFFARFGQTLPISDHARDYQPGDIIAVSPQHIAFISDKRVRDGDGQLVVLQNNGLGVREDVQGFASPKITGHFRYQL